MNSKRRAELQRKLTLNAVPRPPAGLVERIKADIPQHLEAETVPQRLTRSFTFHMRIAASVIVLAGSVMVAMMVTRSQQKELASGSPVIFAPQSRSMTPATTTTTVPVARTEEVELDIVQEQPIVVPEQIASARVAPPIALSQPVFAEEVPPANDDREMSRAGESTDLVTGVVGGTAGGRLQEPPAEAAPEPQYAYAPEVAAPPPPSTRADRDAEAAAPMAPPAAKMAEALADSARADRTQAQVGGAERRLEARQRELKKESVFGISVNPQVFHEIRATLESGQRPAASAVNVEALVNYFAGPPAKPPRKLNLQVEVSPAVLPAEGEQAVLRFTVDTPAGRGVAASDARIEVVINDATVARVKRIGDGDALVRESVLPHGTSVTGLYALEMKPGLRSSQLVATVRLHYVLNGEPKTIAALVHGHDLGRSWQRSSRRHRLASLGALWAESLKGTAAGGDVAQRANELASQAPGDVRARELALAASASADGGR